MKFLNILVKSLFNDKKTLNKMPMILKYILSIIYIIIFIIINITILIAAIYVFQNNILYSIGLILLDIFLIFYFIRRILISR